MVPAQSAYGTTIVTPNEVYTFVGACSDCIGNGTATLTLTGGYTLGTAITSSTFVRFVYNGTNLLGAFTILPTDAGFGVSGVMPTNLPGPAQFTVDNSQRFFDSFAVSGTGWQ